MNQQKEQEKSHQNQAADETRWYICSCYRGFQGIAKVKEHMRLTGPSPEIPTRISFRPLTASTPEPTPISTLSTDNNDNMDTFISCSSKSGSYRLNMNRQIFQLRRYSVDIDVQICAKNSTNDVKNVVIPCHKIFLRSCPYFAKLLDETPRNDGQILKIDIDLDPEILEEILRFIYTGEIKINNQNMVKLVEASLKLQLNDIMTKFTKFQIGQLVNQDNWLDLLKIFNSPRSGGGKILKEIFGFLRGKSSEFMNWPTFLQLTFAEIRLILNAESRIFKNAKDFQSSLLKWVAHDTSTRSHLIDQLSSCTYEDTPEIVDLSSEESENDDNGDSSSVSGDSSSNSESEELSDSDDGPSFTKRPRLTLVSPASTPITPTHTLLFCAGNHFYKYSINLYENEYKIRKLQSRLPIPDLRGFSMICANDRLYILGGYDRKASRDKSLSNKMYSCSFDDLKNDKKVTWEDEEVLIEMANLSTFYINRKIYVVGGIYNDEENEVFHKTLDCTYSLNLEDNSEGWLKKFPCEFARSQSAMTPLHHEIYLIGGIGHRLIKKDRRGQFRGRIKVGFEDTAIKSVLAIDTTEKLVQTAADLHLARFDHQAVTFQNKIFAIGGKVIKSAGIKVKKGIQYKYTDSVEIYDPMTDTWTDGPSLCTPRANFAAFILENKIFVLGGNVEKNLEKPTMEVYDPVENNWRIVPCGDFPIKTNFSKFLLINQAKSIGVQTEV